jgi:hypothetical protein
MNSKSLVTLCMVLGSSLGGAIPLLWGDGFLSFSSVVLSGLGACAGIYFGFKVTR